MDQPGQPRRVSKLLFLKGLRRHGGEKQAIFEGCLAVTHEFPRTSRCVCPGQEVRCVQCAAEVAKTFLTTWRPAGGVIRAVLVWEGRRPGGVWMRPPVSKSHPEQSVQSLQSVKLTGTEDR